MHRLHSFFGFLFTLLPFFSYGTCSFTSDSSKIFIAEINNEFEISVAPPADIILSPDTPLPPGLSFIDNHDGTAKLFGIPEHSSNLEESFNLTFISRKSQDPAFPIAEYYECKVACEEDPNGRVCNSDKCDICTQHFTLVVSSSPCDFENENSTRFTNETEDLEQNFLISVPSSYLSGHIDQEGDLPENVSFNVDPSGTFGYLVKNGSSTPGCYPIRFSFSGEGCSSQQDFLGCN